MLKKRSVRLFISRITKSPFNISRNSRFKYQVLAHYFLINLLLNACESTQSNCDVMCRLSLESFIQTRNFECKTSLNIREASDCHFSQFWLAPMMTLNQTINLTSLLDGEEEVVKWSIGIDNQEVWQGTKNEIKLDELKDVVELPNRFTFQFVKVGCSQSFMVEKEVILLENTTDTINQTIIEQFTLPREKVDFSVWGTEVIDYQPGLNVDSAFSESQSALGSPSFDDLGRAEQRLPIEQTLSLGEGGVVTILLSQSIGDEVGPDLGIYENSFNGSFVEYAWVEVSSDGEHFVRFPNLSFSNSPLHSFEEIEGIESWGLAGNGLAGTPTLFDLADLKDLEFVRNGLIDIDNIRYVKIRDIVGDGTAHDSYGKPIYDPYPTESSAGFDLDAVGARPTTQLLCK